MGRLLKEVQYNVRLGPSSEGESTWKRIQKQVPRRIKPIDIWASIELKSSLLGEQRDIIQLQMIWWSSL